MWYLHRLSQPFRVVLAISLNFLTCSATLALRRTSGSLPSNLVFTRRKTLRAKAFFSSAMLLEVASENEIKSKLLGTIHMKLINFEEGTLGYSFNEVIWQYTSEFRTHDPKMNGKSVKNLSANWSQLLYFSWLSMIMFKILEFWHGPLQKSPPSTTFHKNYLKVELSSFILIYRVRRMSWYDFQSLYWASDWPHKKSILCQR